MYLGITLNRLDDFESSCQAFEKALSLDDSDCMIFLNYAVVLFNNGFTPEAKQYFLTSEKLFMETDEEDKEQELLD